MTRDNYIKTLQDGFQWAIDELESIKNGDTNKQDINSILDSMRDFIRDNGFTYREYLEFMSEAKEGE